MRSKTIVWTIIQFKQCMKHVPTYPIFFTQIICNDTKHLWTCFQLALHICCKSLRVFNFWITLQKGLCTIQWNHKNWKIGGGGRRKPISRFHRFPVVCWRLRERERCLISSPPSPFFHRLLSNVSCSVASICIHTFQWTSGSRLCTINKGLLHRIYNTVSFLSAISFP